MPLRALQHHAVDAIKRHALQLSLGSPRAQAAILTEYLWTEEGAESETLGRTLAPGAAPLPAWVPKLIDHQLADERRHAQLFRDRLAALGIADVRAMPALARAKLWWLERACRPYLGTFAAGPIVVTLAVAAQLEATGVRMYRRHLHVLEDHARAADPTAAVLREIVADEQRHTRSCAAAVQRLVRRGEHAQLAALEARIETIDRAFGTTIAAGFWLIVATRVLRDRASARGVVRREVA